MRTEENGFQHPTGVADDAPAPAPDWCAERLTFEDLADYLGALAAKLNSSWLHPLDEPIEMLARFAGTLSRAARIAVDPHRPDKVPNDGLTAFWHHAAGDGRADLACALMDFCEIAGSHGRGDR